MKKIVVNKDYGGFGLSRIGIEEYLKRKGKEAYFYDQTQYRFGNGTDRFEKVKAEDEERHLTFFVFTKDYGEVFTEWPEGDNNGYFYDKDVERDDIDLIAIVEQLKEKSWGRFAKLEIVEIPDDVNWQIEEYDGLEWIAETHRTW